MKRKADLRRRSFVNLQSGVDRTSRIVPSPEISVPSFRKLILASVTLLLAAPALAQTVGQASGQRQESPVPIQATFNFFVAGPSGEGEEAQKLRDKARRIVYEMAARECDLLREVLAKDCRMVSVSSNVGRQYGQQQPEGYTVNGSVSLQITLK
jgi:hypothetical protein